MIKKETNFLIKLINKYNKSKDKKFYSLVGEPFSNEDIIAGVKTLLTRKITMSSITKKFENEFAKFVGVKICFNGKFWLFSKFISYIFFN